MKEAYFTLETIDSKAKNLLLELDSFSKRREMPDLSKDTALLVLDMQEYFLDENSHAFVPSASAIIQRIKKLADVFIKRKLPVIFTRHINDRANAGRMADWWRDMIRIDGDYNKIAAELKIKGSIIVQKSQYDAFFDTSLDETLKSFKIRNLLVCGVMTHLCCESTIRQAFTKGYHIVFPIDTTATYNYEHHRASFINIAHGFAQPVLYETVLKILTSKKVINHE